MSKFSEQIIECDELRKTICKRAEEILRLAIIEAPNSFRVTDRFKDSPNYTCLESFDIYNDEIHFRHSWYNETMLGLHDEYIPLKLFNMTDNELCIYFHNIENEWEEDNKERLQKKATAEKEERRKQYQKLKEEFENESGRN